MNDFFHLPAPLGAFQPKAESFNRENLEQVKIDMRHFWVSFPVSMRKANHHKNPQMTFLAGCARANRRKFPIVVNYGV